MRTKTWALLPVALSSFIAMGCDQMGGGSQEMAMTVDLEALRAEIEALNVQWVDAYNAGDAASLAALYTEDATMLPAGGGRYVGRAAIEEWRAAELATTTMRDITATTIDVGGAGDFAYEVGHWSSNETTVEGEEIEVEGTYTVVHKRMADGSLKLHVETWTVDEAEME